ncbi:hypothetical protein PIB30_076709 [Stylosanthes scabra]|uniref:Uncharacterized protein n=1 Tax=Stylosanthes scabra TaxID=79078 RepID=A0ABU6RQG7_9FABA|nr:hypothetical protein [Stylosanthes scabra]
MAAMCRSNQSYGAVLHRVAAVPGISCQAPVYLRVYNLYMKFDYFWENTSSVEKIVGYRTEAINFSVVTAHGSLCRCRGHQQKHERSSYLSTLLFIACLEL